MNILSVQGLTKAHGIKQLFSNLAFGVEDDDRVGVIGANGTGKSTLLKVLAGEEPADAGNITLNQGLRIEYAPQNPAFDPGHTVLQHIFASQTELSHVVAEYEELCHKMETAHSPEVDERFSVVMSRMDALNGWEYETRAKTVLGKLGVNDLEAMMGSLSGGYRKRVTLARALLAEADLLILDEPTNHLDADTVSWLEEYLNRMPGALLLVTHDRYFLDRVTRRIVELDGGDLRNYDGNFSYYLEKKAEQEAADVRADERRRSMLRKELEWLRRGARARRTKEKHRVERVHEMQAQGPMKKMDALKFESGTQRIGTKIVELEKVTKSLGGRTLIKDFTYTMTPGEKMGVIGANGAGKTTLVNLITNRLAPDAGTIEVGLTVKFGFFDQESADLDMEERAIDYVKRDGGAMLKSVDGTVLTAERMMERFGFTSQMLYSAVGKLSGGERRRLHLVRTLMKDPNFLILDEPTNDLDIPTLQALEDYLDGFVGCLLVVSHDRYFLDRTVDHLLAVEGDGELKIYHGDYATVQEARAEYAAEKLKPAAAAPVKDETKTAGATAGQPVATEQKKPKLSFKEQRELADLEVNVVVWEDRLKAIDADLAAGGTDYMVLQDLTKEQTELSKKLEAGLERWAELAERAGQ